jgi:hypothetical protein
VAEITTNPKPNRWFERWFAARWLRVLLCVLALLGLSVVVAGAYAWHRFLSGDSPVAYEDPVEHFKYGSTGGERTSGFPYWIFQVLPKVCAAHLPDVNRGYASLGFLYEPGKDLPIGMSKRHYQGIDRTFLNCAVCHTSTVRAAPDAAPRYYVGGPSNNLNLMAFERFLFDCAKDPKLTPSYVVPEVRAALQAQGDDLDLIDRYLVYPLATLLMRDRLISLADRFSFVAVDTAWGPGRVDTFNSAKVLFHFPMDRIDPQERNAGADFPSVWLQGKKKGMQLHWDGNNDEVTERNRNAAFGTGATPPTLDRRAIHRIEDLLWTMEPPPFPYPIDATKAARGGVIYAQYCAGCHGAGGRDFSGDHVGKVTPRRDIGTDPQRLDSFTYVLAANLGTPYAGYEDRFQHFRKTFGYANLPLDGLWLRAPYLHNGSVPSVRDLLEPTSGRPAEFYRGNDVYDPVKLGFVSSVAREGDREFFKYVTSAPGNGNAGHEGSAYGTQLSSADKDALVEFLKGF